MNSSLRIEQIERRGDKRLFHLSNGVTLLTPGRAPGEEQAIDGIVYEVCIRDDYLGHPFLSLVRPEPGDAIIDIGGHVGSFAIHAATRFPNLRVHSFEPMPANFALLGENVRLNGLSDRVAVSNVAVASGAGERTIFASAANSGLNSFYPVDGDGGSQVKVRSIQLAEYLDQHAIRSIFAMKLDCEGAEYEILYRCPTEIFKRTKLILLEYHTITSDVGTNPDSMGVFLAAQGYFVEKSVAPIGSMIYAIREECVAPELRDFIPRYSAWLKRTNDGFAAAMNVNREAFAHLVEDRAAAQQIMDHQAGVIESLRGNGAARKTTQPA